MADDAKRHERRKLAADARAAVRAKREAEKLKRALDVPDDGDCILALYPHAADMLRGLRDGKLSDERKESEARGGEPVEIPAHLLAQGYVVNLEESALKVRHSELEPVGEGPYRRRCPKCKKGLLMMARDLLTFRLRAEDRCTRCAQLVIYLDDTIAGEPVQRPN